MTHAQKRREKRKGFSRNYDKHHRVPKSRQRDVRNYDVHDPRNIIIVPANAHKYFHSLLANLLPHEVAQVLSAQWIDPRAELLAVWRSKATDEWKKSNGGVFYW